MMPKFAFISFFRACCIVSDGVQAGDYFSTVKIWDKCKNRINGIASKKVTFKLGVEISKKEILQTKFSVVNIIFTELRELINFIKIELSCYILKIIGHDLCRCNR